MMNIRLSRAVPAREMLVLAAIPLSLAIFSAQAFAASKLASIEFNPTGAATNIVLHSETVLPYNIAYNSDRKLMIDIDNVASEATIDTQFVGGSEISAISNVIIQPLSKNSLRLIIRGERLSAPKVSFVPIRPGSVSQSTAKSEGEHLLKEDDGVSNEENTHAALALMPEANANPAVHQAPAKPAINQNGIASDIEDTPLTPMSQSDVSPPEPRLSEDPVEMGLAVLKQIETSPYLAWTPYVGLGILLLGLGLFIKRKLDVMRRNPDTTHTPAYDGLMPQQTNGRAIGFQQLAEAYRMAEGQMGLTEADYLPSRLRPGLPSQTAHNQRDNVKNTGLIGLGGLSQLHASELYVQPQDYAQYDLQAGAKARELLPTAMPQPQSMGVKNRKAQAPAKTALNQYAQAQRQNTGTKPKNQAPAARKNQLNDDMLRQELQQASRARYETKQQLRQEHSEAVTKGALKGASHLTQSPIHRQALKQRQSDAAANGANPNAPLSGNPEVLNFLRDVAELMDKDGRSQSAQSFRKGLNPG